MKLYLITGGDAVANLDLLVRARSKTDAMLSWRHYYSLGSGYKPDHVFEVVDERPEGGALAWGIHIKEAE